MTIIANPTIAPQFDTIPIYLFDNTLEAQCEKIGKKIQQLIFIFHLHNPHPLHAKGIEIIDLITDESRGYEKVYLQLKFKAIKEYGIWKQQCMDIFHVNIEHANEIDKEIMNLANPLFAVEQYVNVPNFKYVIAQSLITYDFFNTIESQKDLINQAILTINFLLGSQEKHKENPDILKQAKNWEKQIRDYLFKIINKKDIDLSWKNLIAPQEHINKFQNIVSKKVASEEKQQMKELQINFFIDNLKLMFFQDFLVLGKFFKHTLDQLSIKKLIKEMTDYYKKILDIAIKNSTNEKNLQTLNSIFLILNNFILINIDIDNEPQKTAYLTERFYCDLANLSNQEIYELNLYPEVIQIATAILMLEPKKTQPNFKKIDIVVDKLFRLFPQMKEDFPELIVEASTKIWVCGLNLWLKNKPQSLKLMNKYQLLEETYKLEISTDQQQVHKMLFCSYLEMLKKNYLSSKEVEFDNERNKIKIHCGNDVNLQKKNN